MYQKLLTVRWFTASPGATLLTCQSSQRLRGSSFLPYINVGSTCKIPNQERSVDWINVTKGSYVVFPSDLVLQISFHTLRKLSIKILMNFTAFALESCAN
ncbi:unnamed protein product [Calicophoron daubneyi]|uniref:Secreted protein n=1 Tax=Calicophoron daubneyi TaxID=300641 RepID=A0AAV2T4S1_CALDB